MTINLAEYAYKLTLDKSEYTNSMRAAETQAEGMKTKLSGIGSFLKTSLVGGLIAAAGAIAGTIVAGVKATAELDEQMSKFRASTGATTEETQKIRDLAQELYKTNTDSMEDIVATSEEMVKRMGLTTEEVEKYQQSYMDYAKTTGQANTDVIAAIDRIGDAWGLTAEESVRSIDMLKKSSEEFGTDITAVQTALSQVAPAAKALGLSFEETNGYMNLFAASGLDASQSVTAFSYAAKQVKSPEQFKQMVQDISAISDPTARAQKAVELFGSKAGVAMANVDTSQLDEFIITMDEAAGTVSSASEAFDDNFNVKLQLVKKQFTGLAQEIGEKFMPVLSDVMDWVSNNMPQIMATIEGAISFISGIIDPFITVIRNVISAFQDTEGQTNTSFSAIQEVIQTVTDTIQTIIDVFVTLFTSVWEKWGSDITSFAQTNFDNIMNIIQIALDLIQGIAQLFINIFTGNWKAVFEDIKNIASTAWELVKAIFQTAVDNITGIAKAGFTLLGTIVSGLMDAMWTGIKIVWQNIVGWFDTAISGLLEWFNGLGSAFFNIGSSLFNWVWDGMKSIWESITKWVQTSVDWLADKLSFWRSSTSEMSSGSIGGSRGGGLIIDGSHATGLPYVWKDNYVALLHKGERVLTAKENAAYSSGAYNQPTNPVSQQAPVTNHYTYHIDYKGNNFTHFITSMEQYQKTHSG